MSPLDARMLLDDTAGVGIQSIYAEWHISVEHRELFYTGSELFLRVRGLACLRRCITPSGLNHRITGSPADRQQSCGPSLRVLIVSDVRFFREGLSEALPHLSRIAVVATAEDGDQALALRWP